MKANILQHLLLSFFLITITVNAISLQEMYDNAVNENGYDKYIELETGVTYTGGLELDALNGDPDQDVAIIGNGAVIYMDSSGIVFSNIDGRLDVENCVIVKGQIRYKRDGIYATNPDSIANVRPVGSVKYVTFYQPYNYGIRLKGTGTGILLERNLIMSTIEDECEDEDPRNPTGIGIAFSSTEDSYGSPEIIDNWSFKSSWEDHNGNIGEYWKLCESG